MIADGAADVVRSPDGATYLRLPEGAWNPSTAEFPAAHRAREPASAGSAPPAAPAPAASASAAPSWPGLGTARAGTDGTAAGGTVTAGGAATLVASLQVRALGAGRGR